LTAEQKKAQKGTASASRRSRSSGKHGTKRRLERREVPLTVFIHIPKTAGTTLNDVLRTNFPPGTVRSFGNVFAGAGRVSVGPVWRLQQSGHVMTRSIHLLGGHIPYGVHEFLPADSRYITFLRDPIERTLSHYYRLMSMHRSSPFPGLTGEPTLEQMLEEREFLYDNLQTRMLSGLAEPFDDVTDEMLEQAKENLDTGFAAFGLTDRFDESLVLLKHRLGLRSVMYVSKRLTTTRPRTAESKAELTPVAERFNAYDIELYRWAAKRFDETIAQQGTDFAVDLAALKAAVSGGSTILSPPPASALSRQQLWEELVRARADVLGWEYDNNKIPEKDAVEAVDELRGLLEEIGSRLDGLETGAPGQAPPAGESNGDVAATAESSGKRRDGRDRTAQLAVARDRKEAQLEELRQQIEELEAALGGSVEESRDPHVVREIERLRGLAEQVEDDLQAYDERRQQAEESERAAEQRQIDRERQSLTKRRDSTLSLVERTESRIKALREQLDGLPSAEGASPGKKGGRRERVEALIASKEQELEAQRERLSEAQQNLDEFESSYGQSPGQDEAETAAEAPAATEPA